MVAHHDAGDATPVLFVHADGGVLGHWDQIRAHLSDRPNAAFDRRGHGQSQPPRNGSFEQADAAGDISAVADALGWKKFVLVAHSGGAANAFIFAALHPERLAGLLLVDPSPDPAVIPAGVIDQTLKSLRSDAYRNVIERHFRAIAGDDRTLSDRILADARATPQATLIGAFEAMKDFRPTAYAGRYPGPMLSVIQSQYDIDGALHRIAPTFPHAVIDGAGHWIHLGAPARFARVLNDFLSRLEGRRNPRHSSRVSDSHATPHHSP